MKRNFTLLVIAVALSFSATAQDQGPVFSPASGSESASADEYTPGVEQVEDAANINIYSFEDKIYIHADLNGAIDGTAKVYDITGRLVITERISSSRNVITSEELKSSYYIVALDLNGKTYTSRVFVK